MSRLFKVLPFESPHVASTVSDNPGRLQQQASCSYSLLKNSQSPSSSGEFPYLSPAQLGCDCFNVEMRRMSRLGLQQAGPGHLHAMSSQVCDESLQSIRQLSLSNIQQSDAVAIVYDYGSVIVFNTGRQALELLTMCQRCVEHWPLLEGPTLQEGPHVILIITIRPRLHDNTSQDR